MININNNVEKIKLLDFIIERIEDSEFIDLQSLIQKNKSINEDNLLNIYDNIKSFGEKHNVLEETGTVFRLTKNGEDLKTFGKGFVKFQEQKNKKNILELENLKLQNESLIYRKTIRKQEQRIMNLEEQIKILNLLKLYWWLIPSCIMIGVELSILWNKSIN